MVQLNAMESKNEYTTLELKSIDESEEGVFEGYASTFGNTDSTGDIIVKGAFTNTLKNREPKVLWQHDMQRPVGKVIEAREDEKGLYVKVKLAIKTSLGSDAYEYMKADIINRLSIGFRTVEAEYDQGSNIRTIKEIDLFEFSLVTIPANEEAEVTGVKSVPENEREFEKFLRANGYSRTAAKTITARGIKGYQDVLRDAGVDTPNDDLRDADNEVKNLLSKILQTIEGEKNGSRNPENGGED